jgi:hypothetical protein
MFRFNGFMFLKPGLIELRLIELDSQSSWTQSEQKTSFHGFQQAAWQSLSLIHGMRQGHAVRPFILTSL